MAAVTSSLRGWITSPDGLARWSDVAVGAVFEASDSASVAVGGLRREAAERRRRIDSARAGLNRRLLLLLPGTDSPAPGFPARGGGIDDVADAVPLRPGNGLPTGAPPLAEGARPGGEPLAAPSATTFEAPSAPTFEAPFEAPFEAGARTPASANGHAVADGPGFSEVVDRLVEGLARRGATERKRGQRFAGAAVTAAVDAIAKSPLVDRVVDAQVDRLLRPLVQTVLADVLAQLEREPERIHSLVRGQRDNMVDEVVGRIRTSAVAGDSAVDRLTARMLRRTRAAIPAPIIDLP